MLQNVMLTAMTPLINKRETQCWENRPFTTIWPEKIPPKPKDITRTIKKKQKRIRTAFSTDQLRALERTYSRHKYIDSQRRLDLAKTLNIGEKSIKIWFQNRRMKEKKESSESSSDSSSESFVNETTSVSTSPPLQSPEGYKNEYSPIENQYPTGNGPDHLYHLPTYSTGSNGIIPNIYEGMQAPNMFFDDNNVYPTQYYPMNYSYNEGNCYNGYYQYGNDSNYWGSNHNCYYAPI